MLGQKQKPVIAARSFISHQFLESISIVYTKVLTRNHSQKQFDQKFKNLSLTSRKEHRLKVFENKCLGEYLDLRGMK
jgi:hypothetical protein